MLSELPVPATIRSDPKAREILRVWVAHERQHVCVATEIWEDPAAWGIMVVDLCRHIAAAFEHASGRDRGEVLRRIKAGFDAEWDNPTDVPSGGLVDEP